MGTLRSAQASAQLRHPQEGSAVHDRCIVPVDGFSNEASFNPSIGLGPHHSHFRPGRVPRQPPTAAINPAAASIRIGSRQPPPVTILPTLRCRPLFVSGIPVALEILDLARVTPIARFQENPPLFTARPFTLAHKRHDWSDFARSLQRPRKGAYLRIIVL